MIKYLNLLLFAVMLVMNYLANALPLNTVTTGELSESYPYLFVPAGITFSIWGLIYTLLAVFCVIQFTGKNQHVILGISPLFGVSCLLNAFWIVSWHYKMPVVSLVIMTLLLILLVIVNSRISNLPMGLIKGAFGVYLGWICIATIANVTAVLVHAGWTGFGIDEESWAIIMIIAGATIASVSMLLLNNPFTGLPVIWAFAGIAIKRQADFRNIFIAAICSLIIVAVITGWGFIRKYSRPV